MFSTSIAAVSQDCTQANYDACTARVSPYMGSVLAGIVPTISVDFLDEHCP